MRGHEWKVVRWHEGGKGGGAGGHEEKVVRWHEGGRGGGQGGMKRKLRKGMKGNGCVWGGDLLKV